MYLDATRFKIRILKIREYFRKIFSEISKIKRITKNR